MILWNKYARDGAVYSIASISSSNKTSRYGLQFAHNVDPEIHVTSYSPHVDSD